MQTKGLEHRPRITVTLSDPSEVGSELVAKLLGHTGTVVERNFVSGIPTSDIAVKGVPTFISDRSVFKPTELSNGAIEGSVPDTPRIAVCALNPHAGEGGQIGREEIYHIDLGAEREESESLDASSLIRLTLYSSEFAFGSSTVPSLTTIYNDQAQIMMVPRDFDEGVSVQGGLPVLSVP